MSRRYQGNQIGSNTGVGGKPAYIIVCTAGELVSSTNLSLSLGIIANMPDDLPGAVVIPVQNDGDPYLISPQGIAIYAVSTNARVPIISVTKATGALVNVVLGMSVQEAVRVFIAPWLPEWSSLDGAMFAGALMVCKYNPA